DAVADEPKIRARAVATAAAIREAPPPLPDQELAEGVELLEWLADGHFTFLGYRDYTLTDDGTALRPEPGTGLGILRGDTRESGRFAALPPEVRATATGKDPVVI